MLLALSSCSVSKQTSTEKLPIVYSNDYNIGFYGIQKLHPFDTGKYAKVAKHLNKSLGISKEQFHVPYVITDAELLKVHSQTYLESLNNKDNIAAVTEMGIMRKLPIKMLQNKLLKPFKLATGGTLVAGELAMQQGWAINLSGGYHHAKRNNGEGFCFFADVNLLIETLREKNLIKTAMVVDLDAHQGNGHQSIHGADSLVTIFDMYHKGIYPNETELFKYIDYNIPLAAGTKDEKYLSLLKAQLPKAIAANKPDIIIYVAGTDIYELDPLGGLGITKQGIIERDAFVFQNAVDNNIPVVMTLSGGYHKDSGPIIGESIENLLRTVLKDE
ncbi:UNVERIFIED_CONTAM: hypothetical protein GTU68_014412 [Idotea baltica]|nr:hypothetical protein [Idotea baltica]